MSKLPKVGTTIFSVMSKMAVDHNAINLSQGFPNFPVDSRLLDIYRNTIEKDVHQYAPMPGHPLLLEAIGSLIYRQYGRMCRPDTELLVTAGATQAIFTTIQALVGVGDEVIILDPCYDCYDPAIVLSGGTAVHIPLNADFLPDWEHIASAVTPRTRLIITNNPHNPSGRVWSTADFEALETIVEQHDQLLILSDEVYEFITFEKKHLSAHQRNKLTGRTLVVSSFGKTFHITGWKVGYVAGPEHLLRELKKVHQFLVFSVNSVAQATLAAYLPTIDVNELGPFYQQKRDLFRALMQDSRFDLLPGEGSYFQLASYRRISDEGDVDFTKRLVQEYKVAAIPVSVFCDNGQDRHTIRFCFAKTDETLIEAAEKLCRI